MALLVSVRSTAEAEAALSGGADILDAKEPRHGSLGAVTPAVLAEIFDCVPSHSQCSVALGDLAGIAEVQAAVRSFPWPTRPAPVYLKLGFAGVATAGRIQDMVDAAVSLCSLVHGLPRVVAVAYADFMRAAVPPPLEIAEAACRAGAAGVLLDTCGKDGRGLLSWMDLAALTAWVDSSRGAGLLTALAGGLCLEDLPLVSQAGPDVVGVRGAACSEGRFGRVTAERVRALRAALPSNSGSLQGSSILSRNAGISGRFLSADRI
jgi:uncharacterized protein (UPF0264 family)